MKDNRNQLMTLAEQRIRLLYTNAYEQAMKIAEVRKALDAATDESFTFKANPRAEKELRKILEELGLKLDNLIISGKKKLAKDGVEMAGNNILAKVAASQKPLAERLIQAAANANRSAQAIGMEIANEKHGGVKLSANVWKAVESSRKELEIIIQNNIIEGKGADVASREVRQYLRDPNRLYRRVKDKTTGEYKLSKAAQQYHPGQGRYRSSYMNARRLAVTEMNMATQAAECAAYADNPLVAGYEIRLSNNHTVKDPKHPGKVNPLHDVCDELQGKYPATFRFTGWHPHCRCTMIPILISAEERRKLAQARAEGKDYTPKGIITDVPANYKAWVAKNQDRIASAKTLPYFLQDNGEMTDDGYKIGGFDNVGATEEMTFRQATIEQLNNNGIEVRGKYEDSLASDTDFDFVGLKKEFDSIAKDNGMGTVSFTIDECRNNNFVLRAKSDGMDLVRNFKRTQDGKLRCYNDMFRLDEKLQGKGISKRVLQKLYVESKRMGVDYTEMVANLDVGGYTWAKYGYYARDKYNATMAVGANKRNFIEDWYKKNGYDSDTPFPMRLIADMPDGKRALLGSRWHGIFDFHNAEQTATFEDYLGLNKQMRNKIEMSNVSVEGHITLSTKDANQLRNSVYNVARKAGLFTKSFNINFEPMGEKIMMSWNDSGLKVSTNRMKLEDGTIYCPALELKSALQKLQNKQPLTFKEEYSIESLFHENVHSKAKYKTLNDIEENKINEKIVETCTQLYAREKYINVLRKYDVKPNNFEEIKRFGLGYNPQCNKMRRFFEKDGVLQVGELINIANNTENGVTKMKAKLRQLGLTEEDANKCLIELLKVRG